MPPSRINGIAGSITSAEKPEIPDTGTSNNVGRCSPNPNATFDALARISHTSQWKGGQGVLPDFENRGGDQYCLNIDDEQVMKGGVTNCSDFPEMCEKCGLANFASKNVGLFRSSIDTLYDCRSRSYT